MLLIFIQNIKEIILMKSLFDSSRYLNSLSSYKNSKFTVTLEKKESRFNDLYFFPEMFTMLFQISRVFFQESRLSFVWCLG